ncbi:hypothetical protein PLICRDRAFT_174276 [Plicaturopsis crispa FD-325 SS-3]|nr:hypothetical protein PLICRDRAFT_174276 [Plicaturopsis crispa FD-325 SS-3]
MTKVSRRVLTGEYELFSPASKANHLHVDRIKHDVHSETLKIQREIKKRAQDLIKIEKKVSTQTIALNRVQGKQFKRMEAVASCRQTLETLRDDIKRRTDSVGELQKQIQEVKLWTHVLKDMQRSDSDTSSSSTA